MPSTKEQLEENRYDIDATLLLAIARSELESGTANLSMSVDDDINKEALYRLFNNSRVTGKDEDISNHGDIITYTDLHVTLAGITWWEKHNHGRSMRATLEATR